MSDLDIDIVGFRQLFSYLENDFGPLFGVSSGPINRR